jgi:hypothetical protein
VPQPPAGEQQLRDLSTRYIRVEGFVLTTVAMAANDSDRSDTARRLLAEINALRLLDPRAAVTAAYLAAHPEGVAEAVADLAASLAKRLDDAAKTTAANTRLAIRTVTPDTIAEATATATTAAIDARGVRWALGRWAEMNTETIGRQATSRGITDLVGHGGNVTIDTGECNLCAQYSGEATVGVDPLPPFHPNCTCVAEFS